MAIRFLLPFARVLVASFLLSFSSSSLAQIDIESFVNQTVSKVQSTPNACIDYNEYHFTLSHDNFHSMVALLNEKLQQTQFVLDPVLDFIKHNNATAKRDGSKVKFKVNGSTTYETRERLESFYNLDLILAEEAAAIGSNAILGPQKVSTFWDKIQSIDIVDDSIVIDRETPRSYYPLADLDISYYPWTQLLDSNRYRGVNPENIVSVNEYVNGRVVLTFTNGVGTTSAHCISYAFDVNHNFRPLRAWAHSPDDFQSFIGYEEVWYYTADHDKPAVWYKCQATQSGEMSITVREFSNWLSVCEPFEFRFPPRYMHMVTDSNGEPAAVFVEASYLESVAEEDLLYVAVTKVMLELGGNNAEVDFVMDGVVDEKDVERVIQGLSPSPPQ